MQGDEAVGTPLSMAYRLQERAARVGFDWPDARGPLDKVKEELAELERETGNVKRETGKERETGKGKRARLKEEIGDLLFAVVNLSRKLGIDPSQALKRANDKFRRRFTAVEKLARERGLVLGKAKLDELDRLWEEVKAAQGGKGGTGGTRGRS